VLVHGIEALEVECLPTDLPEKIDVDIAALKQVGDGIHVSDIKLTDNIRVLTDEGEMVAVATAPKVEAAETAAAVAVPGAPVEAAQPELSVERGKKEDEE
jgi:large subunit ribosomal protein L25